MGASDALAGRAESVIAETIALARVPAPPLDEAQRADFVRRGLADSGRRVSTGAMGNVLAALLALARQFAADAVPAPAPLHLLFLFSVGEEGEGNLAGVRGYVAERGDRLGAFRALEGHYLGRVATDAVGSRRWAVRLTGRGGHSWEDFGAPSAVHALAHAIAGFTDLDAPPDTTFNVGTIEGGQGVKIVATTATARIDLRSTSEAVLADLEACMQDCFRQEAARSDLRIDFDSLGARPAGRVEAESPLARACRAALAERGIRPDGRAASTDANAALAAGVPALAIGVTRGGGMHSRSEWIALGPVADGRATLRATVDAVAVVLAAG